MFRLLKYDFKRGTLQYFKGYLCAFVICLCSSIYLKNIIADMNAAGVLASHGTIMDYYMYAVKGMETYVLKKDSFRFPYIGSAIMLCLPISLAVIRKTILPDMQRIQFLQQKPGWDGGAQSVYGVSEV